ncbi:MAG: hypothetical protein JXM70_23675 [Pirellulales bacterium]|nr:hypothetical protein [Pirellulales bacterium]
MKILDDAHIVNGWTHTDINGAGATSDIISLADYNHVAIMFDFGNTTAGGDADITFVAADDVSATHTATIATITYRKSPGSTASDTFAAEATVTDSKLDYVAAGEIVPDTDDNCIVVVEFDSIDIKEASTDYDFNCVYAAMGNPGQGCPVGCKFILTQPRYSGATLPAAIA